jgi:hypothetical protein
LNYFLVLKYYLYSRYLLTKFETEYTKLFTGNVGVPQSIVLRPLLYLLYSTDLTASPESTTANFADDAAVVAMDSGPAIASQKL